MTAGLVLEGGGMRGLYTAGVLDVFMEHGVEFAHAVGVSAGAAFGVNIKSRQVGRAIRSWSTAWSSPMRWACPRVPRSA